MMKSLFPLIVLILTGPAAYSHGENKLGPNGGYVRMPGGFHTEVVPEGDQFFKVYLLDVQFSNPLTRDSSVKVQYKRKADNIVIECKPKPKAPYFECHLPGNNSLKEGELVVEAKRQSQAPGKAVYPLPLKLTPLKHH